MNIDMKEIALGFINKTKHLLGSPNAIVEQKATERYSICLTCPLLSDSKTKCDKSKGGCGCYLAFKIRSNSPCPKNKW